MEGENSWQVLLVNPVALLLDPDAHFDGADRSILDRYPLTSPKAMIHFMIGYLVVVFILQAIMSFRSKGFELKWAGAVWNMLMFVASVWMFYGFITLLVGNWSRLGWDWSLMICDPGAGLSIGGDAWFYAFYISKFVEYGDTVFLILRKRPVTFLQLYHHFVTATIIWTAWLYPIPASQWMGPLTNTFVHIFMYAYFAVVPFGLSKSLGFYITYLQIFQFWLCLVFFAWVGLKFFGGSCQGHVGAYTWLCLQYAVFMVMFVMFLFDRTKRVPRGARGEGESSVTSGAASSHKRAAEKHRRG